MTIQSDIDAIARIGAVPAILRVVSEMTGLRLTLVARVTGDSWTACATLDRLGFGLNVGDQLDVATTLCSEVRDSHAPIVIEHASSEPAFCNHPTPKMYGFESYVAFPIFRADGRYFGNLCGLDSNALQLRDDKTVSMLRLFTELISLQLTTEEKSEQDRAALSDERYNADLREKFIAALGHDLRTPLTAVLAGTDFLLMRERETGAREILEQIRTSGKRMSRLVDDLTDFTRGRFGDGIPIRREPVDVQQLAKQVVAEIEAVVPKRTIVLEFEDQRPALLDRSRTAQMISNLVMNAVQHGDAARPVRVAFTGTAEAVRLLVHNHGTPVPPQMAAHLFHPFYRGNSEKHPTGLGLGLFIASQIARAHGGSIEFSSTAEEGTAFIVTLPRG